MTNNAADFRGLRRCIIGKRGNTFMNRQLFDASFRDVHITEGEYPVFSWRFGTAVYEEAFEHNRLVAAGWNTAGYTLNVLDSFPTRLNWNNWMQPQSFQLEADGCSLDYDWEYCGFAKEETQRMNGASVLRCAITLKSRIKPITVKVMTELDGTNVMRRWLEVTNTSEDRHISLGAIAPMAGGMEEVGRWKDYLPDPERENLYDLGYMDKANWGCEGLFKWHALGEGSVCVNGRFRRNRHRHPAFFLRNNAIGTMFFAQLGWAGGYELRFDLDTEDPDSRLWFRMGLDGVAPLLILDPGETFATPEVHIGALQGELDDAVNMMHRHLRLSVFDHADARGVRGWVVGGMGPERLMDVAASKHFMDTIAAVGGETMIIDAGWYTAPGRALKEWHPLVGDWEYNKERYPNGIEEVREYAHEKGLLFGLWMDSERLGKDSRMAKEHPEWIAKRWSDTGEISMVNMADPDACAWVEGQIAHLVEDYGIDLFRLDYNIDHKDISFRLDRGHGTEDGTLRYYRNTLAMYDRLRRRFPNVVFENCAGGGGRTDVGFVRNFTHTWVSDWNTAPRSLGITNGMTMVLPPEWVDRLVSGMDCHTRGSLDIQARHLLFGRPTTNDYNCVGSRMNPAQIDFMRHTFSIYKDFIRPYMMDGFIFHHTPENFLREPQGTMILERASKDGTRSVLGLFRLAGTKEEETVIFPRGLDLSKNYRVRLDNTGAEFTMTGAELTSVGLHLRLSGALTSELVLFTAEA